LLIPTPGQTEQEYLAEYLCSKGWFSTISQKKISVGLIIPPTDPKWTEEIVAESSELLEKSISELLEQYHKKY
jgi:hypothetical protein